MVDFKATVYDGSYHEVDSSEIAFKIAGSMAFKDGAAKADPVILEPIMKVTVTVPEEYRNLLPILGRCIAIDFVFVGISFFSYLWVDDIEAKEKGIKSVDTSLDWFWKNV